MKIGFTGTQDGMTEQQKSVLSSFIRTYKPIEFHHGDCIGADAEAHDIVDYICASTSIIIHPPIIRKKRAFRMVREGKGDRVLPPKPYLDRNQDIVNETEILIAAPKTATEQVRSGTWSTVRYTRKKLMKIILILPSGDTILENF